MTPSEYAALHRGKLGATNFPYELNPTNDPRGVHPLGPCVFDECPRSQCVANREKNGW